MAKTQFVYGLHAVKAMLAQHPKKIIQCYFMRSGKEQIKSLFDQAIAADIPVAQLSRQELEKKLGDNLVHQGVALECNAILEHNEKDIPVLISAVSQPLVLVLDQVQDPHNLGACLRSANAMGACCVLIPKDRSAGLTPVAQKVACGATVATPVVAVTNLSRTLKKLQDNGLWIVGLSANTDCSLSDIDLSGPIAIVMGGEGKGMRQLTEKHCDYLARIPMQGTVESLNVSVATGITLYEVNRQRKVL